MTPVTRARRRIILRVFGDSDLDVQRKVKVVTDQSVM